MWNIIGILFFLLGVLYIGIEIYYIRSSKRIKMISFIKLLYGLSCGIIAGLFMILYGIGNITLRLENLVVIEYNDVTCFNMLVFLILSVIGYVSLTAGHYIFNKCIRINKKSFIGIKYINYRAIIVVWLITFIVGFMGLIIWTNDIGGILKFISMASALRGDYENVFENSHRAFRQVAALLPISVYISYFTFLKTENKKYLIPLFLSFTISILYFLCGDGRLSFVMFIVVLLIGFFYEKKSRFKSKKQILILSIVLLLAFITLAKLDTITSFIRTGEFKEGESNVFITLMNEFTFIYKSAVTSISYRLNGGAPLIMDDIGFGVSSVIPGLSTNYTHVWLTNTMLCTNNGYTRAGSIPCDIIAMGFYDLGIIGVILVTFIFGSFIGICERKLSGTDNPLTLTFYYGITLVCLYTVTYCDVYSFLHSMFPYFFVFVVYKVISLLPCSKEESYANQTL